MKRGKKRTMMMNKGNDTLYKIGVVSLGCSKNLVDTEKMLGLLTKAGHTIVKDENEAQVLIINTCGFIEKAKEESIEAILRCAQYKTKGNVEKLIVTGCLSQRYKRELIKELPEVDLFLGVREYERLPGLLLGDESRRYDAQRVLATPHYSAYLRIADGCDNRCSYCAIPLIRGGMINRPMPELIEEGRMLVSNGVKELILIAQDTSAYGRTIYGKPMLGQLMKELSDIDGLHWIRVLYTYPDTVNERLIEDMMGNKKICNYLDIPIQHINDEILLNMKRRGNKEHITNVLKFIRENAPDFMLRTTVMTGFPGETREQFDELLCFLREYPFDKLGAFAFSAEEDTPAYDMKGQIEQDVKEERLSMIMEQQQGISRERLLRRVGSVAEVLVEGRQDGLYYGRSYCEAPDVDGKIFFKDNKAYEPGMFVNIKIEKAYNYDLYGGQTNEFAK